jgi:hypothetical protein
MQGFLNLENIYQGQLIGKIFTEAACTISFILQYSTISVCTTHVFKTSIHLLTDRTNSQFGNISRFSHYCPTEEALSVESQCIYEAHPQGSAPLPMRFPTAEHGHPGMFLFNLAVLAVATRLQVDPWNKTRGYVHFIALYH